MALLDPADQNKVHRSGDHAPTTHPRLCLVAGFGFIIATALAFHVVFNALI